VSSLISNENIKYPEIWLVSGTGPYYYPPSAFFDDIHLVRVGTNTVIDEFRIGFGLRANDYTQQNLAVRNLSLSIDSSRKKQNIIKVPLSDYNFRFKDKDWSIRQSKSISHWRIEPPHKKNYQNGLVVVPQYSSDSRSKKHSSVFTLYSGKGDIERPPYYSTRSIWKLPTVKTSIKIGGEYEGKGIVDIYFWYYETSGKRHGRKTDSFLLPESSKNIFSDFSLPLGTMKCQLSGKVSGKGRLDTSYRWYIKNSEALDFEMGSIDLSKTKFPFFFNATVPKNVKSFRILFRFKGEDGSEIPVIFEDISVQLYHYLDISNSGKEVERHVLFECLSDKNFSSHPIGCTWSWFRHKDLLAKHWYKTSIANNSTGVTLVQSNNIGDGKQIHLEDLGKNNDKTWINSGAGMWSFSPSSFFENSLIAISPISYNVAEFRVGFSVPETDEKTAEIYLEDISIDTGIFSKTIGYLTNEIEEIIKDEKNLLSENGKQSNWSFSKDKDDDLWHLTDLSKSDIDPLSFSLVQVDNETDKDEWVYTGIGTSDLPPSFSGDFRWSTITSSARISAKTKGSGQGDLFFWWYDEAGNRTETFLGRRFFPKENKKLNKDFELPIIPTIVNLTAQTKGNGLPAFHLIWYGEKNNKGSIPLGETSLKDKFRKIEFKAVLPVEAKEFRLAMQLPPGETTPANVELKNVSIQLTTDSPLPVSYYKNRKWETRFKSDFDEKNEIQDDTSAITWNVSDYPGYNQKTDGWGISNDGYLGSNAIYLQKPDEKAYQLHTGSGSLFKPPIEEGLQVTDAGTPLWRLSAFIKGEGDATMWLLWFDEKGSAKSKRIGTYFLMDEYKKIEKYFKIPEGAKSIRIVFLLWKTDKQPLQSIYVDDFTIEQLIEDKIDFSNQVSYIYNN